MFLTVHRYRRIAVVAFISVGSIFLAAPAARAGPLESTMSGGGFLCDVFGIFCPRLIPVSGDGGPIPTPPPAPQIHNGSGGPDGVIPPPAGLMPPPPAPPPPPMRRRSLPDSPPTDERSPTH